MPVKVLFVCLGNICRSPTAEAVFAKMLQEENLEMEILIDSAGVDGYHTGEPPDSRALQTGKHHGLQMSHLRARQVTVRDFHDFDYIVAMDEENISGLKMICPEKFRYKISLLMSHATNAPLSIVPDPYYGGQQGFEEMIELIALGSKGLLEKIKADDL